MSEMPRLCWPVQQPDGPRAGDIIGQDCRACGHNNVLHSNARGCIGCQMVHENAALIVIVKRHVANELNRLHPLRDDRRN